MKEMSKESLEQLSSLMDGELTRDTGLFMTRRLSSDETLSATWERYHLIRDCIRQPGGKQVVSGLSARINASLQTEDAPQVSAWLKHPWLKPVSGLAVAASVALLAIVVAAPQPQGIPGAGSPADAGVVSQPFVSPNTLPLAPVSQAASYAPDQQASSNRLNAYLLRHNQMARTAGRQGFVSFVPIVATASATDSAKPDSDPVPAGSEVEPDTADSGQENTENR
jgi:sigma-E factor negative regulatory protein RseA